MQHPERTRESSPEPANAPEQEPPSPGALSPAPVLRDAVVFAWYVPRGLEALGEHYLQLLHQYHAASRIFIGMNHGSDPAWEARFHASGLDVEIRWARTGSPDYWDATGFLTALEAFGACDEPFLLVWFGHTKGGSVTFETYDAVRATQRRDFWSRRDEISAVFADPTVGFFAPRYNLTPTYPFPGPWQGWRDELAALCRVYRGDFAPLGLCALDTVFVLRGEIVRRFCHDVDPRFFTADLGAFGANKWFFEMAFPSISSMQGFEPFIRRDHVSDGDPRDDVMMFQDTAQVHRLARAEVARWRADPAGFQPRIMAWDLPAWAPSDGIAQLAGDASERPASLCQPTGDHGADAPHSVAHRLQATGWMTLPGAGVMVTRPGARDHALRIVVSEPVHHAFRMRLNLTARGMDVLHLRLLSTVAGQARARDVWLDVARPGALHHDLERVGLYTQPVLHYVEMDLEGVLVPGETLHEITITPASSDREDVPVSTEMTIGVPRTELQQIPAVSRITRFVPDVYPGRQIPPRRPKGKRHAVVFAWFVPPQMPELGEYYLGLLRYYHPEAKLFIGMNHGSEPTWEDRVRAAGLDVEVRWARPELGDYWDTTGFIAALEGLHNSQERFDLVWFGHTKGGSRDAFAEYDAVRYRLLRTFWARRVMIERVFEDAQVGIFAPHFAPLPAGFYGDELPALQRIYRGRFAPVGLHARETFFVMRGGIVRQFCEEAGPAIFSRPPGAYGAGRYFFEIGFPNIAAMQGYEPFIDPDVTGEGHPRDDGWLRDDPRQNHRLVSRQLSAWRDDAAGFVAPRLREIFAASDP
ncbi:MAG: hypothetical protein U0075_00905 [Thermomicrobiales bacterium]